MKINCRVTTSNGIRINNQFLSIYIVSGSKLANTSKENGLRMTAFSSGNSLALKKIQYIFPLFPVLALQSMKSCNRGTQDHFVVDLFAASFRRRADGLTSLSLEFESFL